MEKLVNESIHEFRENKFLNEGIFGKTLETLKGLFQKVGKFFFRIVNGKPDPGAIVPVNIGIMDKNNMLNPAISYIPNEADLVLEPGLRSLTPERAIQKYGPDNVHESINSLDEAIIALEHPDKNVPNIDKKSLYRWIRRAIDNPEEDSLMIWGAPGIGKTQIVKAVLKAKGEGRMIIAPTAQMAPDDWTLPTVFKSEETGEFRAIDIPKSWLPTYKPSGDPEIDKQRDEACNEGAGGVIFFDELSRATQSVQNTCLKIIDEKIVGDDKIGSKWAIIAASNRSEDDPDSDINFGKALGNRFTQVNYVPTFEAWKEWGIDKIDSRILDFLEFNQEHFYNMSDDPEQSIFATPRTWHKASKEIARLMTDAERYGEKITNKDITEVVGATVGANIAHEFQAFLRLLDSFTKEDIKKVLEDPDKARMPKKAGTGFNQAEANALISLVCTSTRGRDLKVKEFTNFCKYLVRLDHPSLATRGLKMMLEIHPYVHEELGEVEGRDKYKEGVDIFIEKYKDIF